jgi:hypothetical protein
VTQSEHFKSAKLLLPVVIVVLVELGPVGSFNFLLAALAGLVSFFALFFDELFLEGSIVFLLSLIGVIVLAALIAIVVVELLGWEFLGVRGGTLLLRFILLFSLSCLMSSSRPKSAISNQIFK